MADFFSFLGGDASKLLAGVGGSALSLKFLPGTWYELIPLAAGGCLLSWYGTLPVARYLSISPQDPERDLISFLLGLFGIAIVMKIYKVIDAIDANSIVEVVMGFFKRNGATK